MPTIQVKEKPVMEEGTTDEANKSEENKITWNDFTQSTTFHGVKYAFDRSGFRWRKWLWTVIVLAACFIFTLQVGLRTRDYYNYDTMVDVQQIYPEHIDFPAVTICNQNAYRITQVKNWKLYDFIDQYYQEHGMTDPSEYPLSKIVTEEFMKTTAHQLEDMVERCIWKGDPCPNNSFNITISPKGVCYSFNAGHSNENETYMTSSTGINGMLQLILNVETYEHMRGPNNDAGIMILLRDRDATFGGGMRSSALAPGKHYMISMEKTEMEQLPEPYGTCDPDSDVSRGQCQQACLDMKRAELCGCHAPHQAANSDPACSLSDTLYCFENVNMTGGNEAACHNCSVPCKKTTYTSKVSFSELSMYNVERMIITDDARRSVLREKFTGAREVRQRVVQETVTADTTLVTTYTEALRSAQETLLEVIKILDLPTLLEKTWPLKGVLADDALRLDHSMALQFYSFYEIEFMASDIEHDVDELELMMYFRDSGVSRLLEAVELCHVAGVPDYYELFQLFRTAPNDTIPNEYSLAATTGSDANSTFAAMQAAVKAPRMNPYFMPEVWLDDIDDILRDVTMCNFTMPTVIEGMRIWVWRTVYARDLLLQLPRLYTDMTSQMFYNTGETPGTFSQHTQCLNNLDDIIQDMNSSLNALMANLDIYSMHGFMDIIAAAVNVTVASRAAKVAAQYDNARKCNWLEEENKMPVIVDYFTKMERARNHMDKVESFSPELLAIAEELKALAEGPLAQLGRVGSAYLGGGATKLDLAEEFFSAEIQRKIYGLRTDATNYERKSAEIASALHIAWFYTKWVFEECIGFYNTINVPIMNQTFVLELNMTRRASTALVDRFRLASTPAEKRAAYYDLTVEVFAVVVGNYLKPATEEVNARLKGLIEAVDGLQGPLGIYLDQTQFGAPTLLDNFVQVDMFYEEIRYDQVIQRPTFSFPSLLSEIGGFLGLLLGASAMTFCEFLDYIALRLYYRFMRRQVAQSPPGGEQEK